uniref:Thioredoxin domain-containing protein n=1 Tax=viral metagenome TaxID=1070528 RepID=A0A6C0M0Z6_9ZZZZ
MSIPVTVIQFSSPTCAPCNQIKLAMDIMKEECNGVVAWESVNVQQDVAGLVGRLAVTSWPTMVVLVGNSDFGRVVGTNVGACYALIKRAVAAAAPPPTENTQ